MSDFKNLIFLAEIPSLKELYLDEVYNGLYDFFNEEDLIELFHKKKWLKIHEEFIYYPFSEFFTRSCLIIFKGQNYHFLPTKIKKQIQKYNEGENGN